MRLLSLLSLCVASVVLAKGSGPETAKIFTDKGSTYFRTDNKKALAVGAELDAVADAKSPDKVLGKAVIMEVTGALARITLDDEAAKAKYVVLPKGGAAPAAEAPIEKGDEAPPRTPGAKLEGRLVLSGLRFEWSNDSDASFTACVLHHSDGSSYDVGEVVKHTDDGVLRVKLIAPSDPPFDHIDLTCAEGEGQFWFDKPNAPKGKLKGYATNDGGGIILYNQMETAWTSCDIRKPNGTHYVLSHLKGHSDDSVAKNRFKKEEDNKPKWIELRCKEGELHTIL